MAQAWPRRTSIDRQFRLLALAAYLALLPFAAWALLHQWQAYRDGRDAVLHFNQFRVSLQALEDLSVERTTTARLISPRDGEPAEDRAAIERARRNLDERLHGLGAAIAAPDCAECGELKADLDKLHADLDDARRRVDALLAAAPATRNAAAARDAFDHLAACAGDVSTLALHRVAVSAIHDPATLRYLYTASMAALLRDDASQLGTEIASALARGLPLPADTRQRIDETRGRIRLLDWLSAAVVPAWQPGFHRLLLRIDTDYMRDGLGYAERTMAGDSGGTRLSAAEFDRRYVGHLRAITDLRDESLRLGGVTLQANQQRQWLWLLVGLAAFVLLTVVISLVAWQFHEKIVRPFIQARRFVIDVAANQSPADATGTGYAGEIRDLFVALATLRDNNQRRVELERDRERLVGELRLMAETDFLTGLLNRRAFYHQAMKMLADRRTAADWLAVTAFDVDHFKQINDRHGHDAGDLALKRLADLCGESWRQDDIVGRLGGEEFAAIARVNEPAQASAAAHRLMERLRGETLRSPDGQTFSFTVSFGVIVARPAEVASLDLLLRQADSLLYRAKLAGRNRVEVAMFVPEPPADQPLP